MTALWTWFTQSSEVSATDVGWSDAADPIEVSKIDTLVVDSYGRDPDVLIIARRNRDTRDEFMLLDRRSGGVFSEWLGNVLGAPPETATIPVVGGPVSTGAIPVISAPTVGGPTAIVQAESPPIVAQPQPANEGPSPYLVVGLLFAAAAAGFWLFASSPQRTR